MFENGEANIGADAFTYPGDGIKPDTGPDHQDSNDANKNNQRRAHVRGGPSNETAVYHHSDPLAQRQGCARRHQQGDARQDRLGQVRPQESQGGFQIRQVP